MTRSSAVAEARPRLVAPPGSCDCHVHIFDTRFPFSKSAPYVPDAATVDDWMAVQRRLGLTRTVIVQASPYGTDNACAEDAIRRLGPGNARGIAKLSPSGTTDAEFERLTGAGFRGVRFQMAPGDALPVAAMRDVAERAGPLGWIVQLRLDGHDLPEHEAALRDLPGTLMIDHTARFHGSGTTESPGFRALLRLVDGGRCWVKLSAPYLSSKDGYPGYADIGALTRALVAHAPERLVWATDWPHTGLRGGSKPDAAVLLDLLLDWAPDEATRRMVLADNPAALYGF